MRVLNCQEFFTTLAHRPLGGKEIFRHSFIGYGRVGRHVTSTINCLSFAVSGTADEAAAFMGIGLPRMRDDLIQMIVLQMQDHGWRAMLKRLDLAKGFASKVREYDLSFTPGLSPVTQRV